MAEKKETTEETKPNEPKERFELAEVPTKTGIFVKDNKSEEVWDDKRVFVEILNKLEKIEKSVG